MAVNAPAQPSPLEQAEEKQKRSTRRQPRRVRLALPSRTRKRDAGHEGESARSGEHARDRAARRASRGEPSFTETDLPEVERARKRRQARTARNVGNVGNGSSAAITRGRASRFPLPNADAKPKRSLINRQNARPAARRPPAIWRGDLQAEVASARPEAASQIAVERGFPWRIVSATIVLLLGAMLGLFFASDAFYIHSVSAAGMETMTLQEVYTLSGVADTHLFWVDPAAVRARLLQSPTIADAQVEIGWEQPLIRIAIQERAPALVWEQAGVSVWLDLQGRVMRQRADRGDLLRVLADNGNDGPPQGGVDPEIVNGAVQLGQLLPAGTRLRYNLDYGLGYNDPRGWEAWFGTGTDMPEKVLIYNAIVADLTSRAALPRTIYVTDPDSPHWCCQAGGQ